MGEKLYNYIIKKKRRYDMGLIKFILKKAVPAPKIEECNSFAFIGPHPDDIEVGCGATVAKLAKQGKRICFIIATDGAYGCQDADYDKQKLIETRKKEALASAKILGVEDVRFLGFPDGGDYDTLELGRKIALELSDFKPDLIFAPDNHMKAEIHPDHLKTGRAAEIAMMFSGFSPIMKDLGSEQTAKIKGIAYYYTDRPNAYVNVTKTFKDKIQALKEHKSQFLADEQMRKDFEMMGLYFKLTAIRFGFRKFCRYADGYRALSILHTHCAPEASDF